MRPGCGWLRADYLKGLSGIGQLHALIAEHAEEPDQVVVGIETDRGLWASALVAAGCSVFAVNPLAVARCSAIATTSRGPSVM